MSGPQADPPSPPPEDDWGSRAHVQTLLLMGVTALGLYLCYGMAAPFLPSLGWALALAVIGMPLQQRLEAAWHRPNLAAALSILLIALIVVVPAALLGRSLVQQAATSAQVVQEKMASGEWRDALKSQPTLGPLLARIDQQLDLGEAVKSSTAWLTEKAASLVKGSVYQLAALLLTFYLLFFLLRDRRLALHALRQMSPLPDAEMTRLLRRVRDTIYVTVYGTLAVSAVQGVLGGLMFWWLGLSAPVLWGMVMAVLGIVPVLGTFIVWLPAAAFLALEGDWGRAAVLALWGLFVVSTCDNLLRPMLVGKVLRLHTVLAFISVVGGLFVFGAAGLILGPVTLTVTLVLLETWARRGAAGEAVVKALADGPAPSPSPAESRAPPA